MSDEQVEYKIISQAPFEDIIELYKAEGWLAEDANVSPIAVNKMIAGSFCFVGAFLGQKMIGMGRALSDGISDAYIQDVVVLKKYRGKKIGKTIIEKLIHNLKEHDIGWIGLIAEPGKSDFYLQFGFKQMKEYVPMRMM